MIESYKFEELLRPIYATLIKKEVTSDEVYNKTNADVLNSGENLFYTVQEIIDIKKTLVSNPDVYNVSTELENLLVNTLKFKDGLPDQKLLSDLYNQLKEYFEKNNY
ncbi:MAG: hypothetical protein ABF711_02545 [Leuconostoc mesenteroides]